MISILNVGPDTSCTAFLCASGTSTLRKGEVLRRQRGGSAVTALGEGGVEERTAEPLIMCNVNASVTHQRLCHSN